MNILVTGATGFLGRHLLPRLAADGHTLRALSRDPLAEVKDATVFGGDILKPESLAEALDGVEVLVHAAGLVSFDAKDARAMWRVHVEGTEILLAAAKKAGVKRVVYISTSGTVAVSEEQDTVATEDSPSPLPIIKAWPYYRSKLFAEQTALSHSELGFPVVCLNPSLLLGPGDEPEGSSTESVRRFLDDQVPASPPGTISFVDVRDVAEAIAAALVGGQGGRRYLLSGSNMTFKEYYARLARIADKRPPMAALPAVTRRLVSWLPGIEAMTALVGASLSKDELDIACHNWSASSDRAEEELGWQPRDPLATLEDTVFDIRAREGELAPWLR
ncbi:MAG: dihydroflavonol-4-reductase [Myxococcota bacterium]